MKVRCEKSHLKTKSKIWRPVVGMNVGCVISYSAQRAASYSTYDENFFPVKFLRCPSVRSEHKRTHFCTRVFEAQSQLFFLVYDITQSVVILHLFDYTVMDHCPIPYVD